MKSLFALLATLALPLAVAFPAQAQNAAAPKPGTQVPATFHQVATRTNQLDYLLYLPKDYGTDPGREWPLVLFLHGSGERGSDVQKVAVHGPPKLVNAGRDFPFILVSPQCPEGQVWDDSVLIGLLDQLQASYKVDPKHVYVTGLSMGGYGTWLLAQKHPERFAAIAPICGGGERIRALLPAQQAALKTLGVWAFHGGKDNVVPLAESERMIEAFKAAGVTDLKLTVYPDDGHDSWTHAYNEPTFFDWLLQHSR